MSWLPADRKIYALRDVTATTESLPLIASSVMSKKIAEGTRALVLDSKVGSGAFLATEAESRELARTMVELGTEAGLVTRALLTDMETPLGRTVGNAVEVEESLEVLAGGGPADVVELTLALAVEMLDAAGLDGIDPAETLQDGSAMDRFRELVAAQGGDLSRPLPIGAYSETISAPRDGTMGLIDAMAVGLTVWRLGAGRSVPGERVQFGAGLRIHRRPGEPVAAGEALFTLYTDTPERFEAAMAEMDGAWSVGDTAAETAPADHRSDHVARRSDDHTADPGLDPAGARRRCCTTTSTAGCGPPRCWSWPRRTATTSCPPPTSTGSRRCSAPPRTADRWCATSNRSRTPSA